jgi:hypothetical protein
MVPRSNQPLAEMGTSDISWGSKGGWWVGAHKLTTLLCRLFRNSGSLKLTES